MTDVLNGRRAAERNAASTPGALTDTVESAEKLDVGRREVEMYIRTYQTLLRGSGEVGLRGLVQAHYNADPDLHPQARSSEPDMSAFIYTVLRLPPAILQTSRVLLGQSDDVFAQHGFQVEQWQAVAATARRRRWFFDGKNTLAAYISSLSDTDDIVPTLVALQIEWNKFHWLLNADPTTMQLLESRVERSSPVYAEITKVVRERLHVSVEDWRRLEVIWGDNVWTSLLALGRERKNFQLRMLGGSHVGFVRSTRRWWGPIAKLFEELRLGRRPVYFVSSNTHSLANLFSGTARRREDELTRFALNGAESFLADECRKIKEGRAPGNWQNFLYFAAREYQRTSAGQGFARSRPVEEQERGIWSVGARHGLDIDAQIFDLAKLHPDDIDPRVRVPGQERSAEGRGVIINIDAPLGMAAYRVLREVLENLAQVKGVYILGEATTLNGSVGDVLLANVVLDEHSQNTYWLDNCFSAADVGRTLIFGAVLENQRAVSSRGAFLQNRAFLDAYYRANYSVVEMEAGPYLDAVYESLYMTRYPTGENINFAKLPYDLGLIHYAADTPYTRGKNLGAGSLTYYGMDSTYAATIAIARRIIEQEASNARGGDAVARAEALRMRRSGQLGASTPGVSNIAGQGSTSSQGRA
ncbi:MAG TPA: hypothetical protein VKQ36_07505 [Ktedonobacterales bacterium]|nr:hypothetical protein [Ktedonobacterales bacterium]